MILRSSVQGFCCSLSDLDPSSRALPHSFLFPSRGKIAARVLRWSDSESYLLVVRVTMLNQYIGMCRVQSRPPRLKQEVPWKQAGSVLIAFSSSHMITLCIH